MHFHAQAEGGVMGTILTIVLVAIVAALVILWLAFKFTGTIVKAVFWLGIKLPVGIVMAVTGLVMMCTIILFPLGAALLKGAGKLIF